MNETTEIHLRALRQQIDALSAKLDSNTRSTNIRIEAIDTRLRKEIEDNARRRERVQYYLLLCYIAVVWSYLIVGILS
jgi:hypothetical protein